MAYIDHHAQQNRAPILVAIGALHAGVIYALVTGLGGFVPNLISETRTEGTNFPLPQVEPDKPKPKPDPNPTAATRNKTSTAAESTVTTTTSNTELTKTGMEVDSGLGGGSGEILTELETKPIRPDPVFTPKLARPIGKASLWVTTDDYPASALRLEQEGTTRFQLSIGADGKVQSCEVTVSSGYAALDKATCDNLRKRGKFAAATDGAGAAVPGTYSSAVRWTIPKN